MTNQKSSCECGHEEEIEHSSVRGCLMPFCSCKCFNPATPREEIPETHNCDASGCSSIEHFFAPTPEELKENWEEEFDIKFATYKKSALPGSS